MKYFSTFSGIGGFELGIGDLAECMGYSEIDKYAIQVYEKHFNHKNYGDITKIEASTLPAFDLLVGGFPCQSFSIAGKRGGFNDTRGTLFFDIARIIKQKQPRFLLLENVKGLLSHDQGKTFYTIISTLDELGYSVEWQVLNSKNFGVPQNRERVFIVGYFGKAPSQKVFPICESDEVFNEEPVGKAQTAHPLRAGYKAGQGGNDFIIHNIYGGFGEKKIREFHDFCPTIRTPKGGGHLPMVAIPVLTPDRLNKRQHGRRFKENGDPSFTLTGQDIYGITDGMKIRRLTPVECERLQGFPDNWTEEGRKRIATIAGDVPVFQTVKMSDTQRYKMCGNAVTVNVVEQIAKKLLIAQFL